MHKDCGFPLLYCLCQILQNKFKCGPSGRSSLRLNRDIAIVPESFGPANPDVGTNKRKPSLVAVVKMCAHTSVTHRTTQESFKVIPGIFFPSYNRTNSWGISNKYKGSAPQMMAPPWKLVMLTLSNNSWWQTSLWFTGFNIFFRIVTLMEKYILRTVAAEEI